MKLINNNTNLTINRYEDSEYVFYLEENGTFGRIIISSKYSPYYNFSTSWNQMSGTLLDFLKSMNDGYFASNLISTNDCKDFDAESTLKNIKDYFNKELNKYQNLNTFKKSLNEELNEILHQVLDNSINEQATYLSEYYFTHIRDWVDFYSIEDWGLRQEIQKIVLLNESFIYEFGVYKTSEKYANVCKLRKRLINLIENE